VFSTATGLGVGSVLISYDLAAGDRCPDDTTTTTPGPAAAQAARAIPLAPRFTG
jgi:hypothetical protein